MIVVVMGVSGCGKSTVGRALAEAKGWRFIDADDFHPAENIRKMSNGIPLNDDDRRPWLLRLHEVLAVAEAEGQSLVLACSALKHAYRQILTDGLSDVRFVHLHGTPDEVMTLLSRRSGHFMKPGMLDSQFATLEVPEHALTIPVLLTCDEQVSRIRAALGD